MSGQIVIAVDATERSLDALALGKLLAEAVGAPAVVVSVFPYDPLSDPSDPDLVRVRDEARTILLELSEASGVAPADVEIIPGHRPARELQQVSEREHASAIVVGSTHRGAVGRVLPGGVGERLLTGASCPVAIAPRGYADHPAPRLQRVGVGFDGSDEARHALEAARRLARLAEARLRVITVFEHVTFGALASGRTGGASVNDRLRAELRAVHDGEVSEHSGEPPLEARFVEGSAADVLAAESAELDLLVNGSRGYGPGVAVLLGGTTHALVRIASCPCLLVPRGASTVRW